MATQSAREAIKNLLSQYRYEPGLGALADRIGVSRVTLYKWAKQGYVSEEFCDKVSEVTGWTLGQLRPDLASHYYHLYERFLDKTHSDPPA